MGWFIHLLIVSIGSKGNLGYWLCDHYRNTS